MDTKRRLLEIQVWNQVFFTQLSGLEKLFYWFVVTGCDNVGVYQHNPRLARFHCDGDINFSEFVDQVNFDRKRLEVIGEKTLWVRDFVRDTWGTIAPKNNLGLSCYKLLIKHNLLDRFIKEYPNSINVGSFREAILKDQKGYGDLPLPQSSPSPAPNLGTAGTINIPIKDSITEDISITKPSPEIGETSLDFEERQQRERDFIQGVPALQNGKPTNTFSREK